MDGEKTKEKILKVSTKLFAKKGFDGTTVDEIAKMAKIPKSLIYYYFKNKKEILKTLFNTFEKNFLEIRDKVIDLLDEDDSRKLELKIKMALSDIILPFMERWKELLKISFIEEMKSLSKGPLFKYFELNINATRQIYEKFNRHIDFSIENMTIYFFIFFLSMISYSIFVEEWGKHYKFDKNIAKGILIENIIEEYKNLNFK